MTPDQLLELVIMLVFEEFMDLCTTQQSGRGRGHRGLARARRHLPDTVDGGGGGVALLHSVTL